ncbi:MAG TPA: Maf family protein [Longimicrobiales bacterium]|nr:Maf family protein [Longimicrobiales bacterium]
MSVLRLVLASASPRRADVLRQLGLDPVVVPAELDEAYLPDETPAEHVERLARAKAGVVALQEPDALVVAGDTVVVDGERVLGKPRDAEHAVAMLTSLAGRAHDVLSGIAIAGEHGIVSGVARTAVRFRAFDEQDARRYVATGEPADKAGAYGIQGLGAALVESVEGDYSCVVGFPVGLFVDLLGRAGWRYAFGSLARAAGPGG